MNTNLEPDEIDQFCHAMVSHYDMFFDDSDGAQTKNQHGCSQPGKKPNLRRDYEGTISSPQQDISMLVALEWAKIHLLVFRWIFCHWLLSAQPKRFSSSGIWSLKSLTNLPLKYSLDSS